MRPREGRDPASGLAWTSWGEAGGPGVVCLHGFLGEAADWTELASRLQGPVIALDLPGHGRSADVDDRWFCPRAVAEVLVRLCRTEGWGRPVLIGYSLGARLGLHAALAHPGAWRGLLLESGSAGLDPPAERRARRRLDAARAAALSTGPVQDFLKDWYRQALFESLGDVPGRVEQLIKARVRRGTPGGWARAVTAFSPGRLPALWSSLPRLTLATHCVAGARDERYGHLARRMARALPAGSAHILSGAGHNVHLEQPAAFSDSVSRFVNRSSKEFPHEQ